MPMPGEDWWYEMSTLGSHMDLFLYCLLMCHQPMAKMLWARLDVPVILLSRNVRRFRGGLVFKAHRPLYHSTLGLRVIKRRERVLY